MSSPVTIDLETIAITISVLTAVCVVVGVYWKLRIEITRIDIGAQSFQRDLTYIKELLLQRGVSAVVSNRGATLNSPMLPTEELGKVEFSKDTLDKIRKRSDELDRAYNFKDMTDKGIMAHLSLAIKQMIENKEIAQEDLEKVKTVLKHIGFPRVHLLETEDSDILAVSIAVVIKENFHLTKYSDK